jgi:hypothetical protein
MGFSALPRLTKLGLVGRRVFVDDKSISNRFKGSFLKVHLFKVQPTLLRPCRNHTVIAPTGLAIGGSQGPASTSPTELLSMALSYEVLLQGAILLPTWRALAPRVHLQLVSTTT